MIPTTTQPAQPRPLQQYDAGARPRFASDLNYENISSEAALPLSPIFFHDMVSQPEKILRQNPLKRAWSNLQGILIDYPSSFLKGFWGGSDYGGDDFLRLGKIPFFLGGLTMIGIVAASGHKPSIARQSAAVGTYFLGLLGTQKLVDKAVKLFTGVDLGLSYQTFDGQVKRVFSDPTFSRYDLMSEKDYEKISKKMGIPGDLDDVHGETQQAIAQMLPKARLAKAILATSIAALGAGFIARSPDWSKVFQRVQGLSIPQQASQVVRETGDILYRAFIGPIEKNSMALPAKQMMWVRGLALGTLALTGGISTWLFSQMKPKTKQFERSHTPPGQSAILNSPSMALPFSTVSSTFNPSDALMPSQTSLGRMPVNGVPFTLTPKNNPSLIQPARQEQFLMNAPAKDGK